MIYSLTMWLPHSVWHSMCWLTCTYCLKDKEFILLIVFFTCVSIIQRLSLLKMFGSKVGVLSNISTYNKDITVPPTTNKPFRKRVILRWMKWEGRYHKQAEYKSSIQASSHLSVNVVSPMTLMPKFSEEKKSEGSRCLWISEKVCISSQTYF